MEQISVNKSFGGTQLVLKHMSVATEGEMTFALYLPPAAETGSVPVVTYLSGLTCTHANAMEKSGAQAWAAKYGLAIVFPDTSPRGEGVANDTAYDLGQGAGVYVNATQDPWAPHFRMWDYVTKDLQSVLAEFPLDLDRHGLTGHSMGGHGALTIAMTLPEQYRALSAFAPIANPTASDWGRKQLAAYLGSDESVWMSHDASLLMAERGYPGDILIDQGGADQFLDLLRPTALADAMRARGQAGTHRMQDGYGHSYYFIASFMEDHIRFHADALRSLS